MSKLRLWFLYHAALVGGQIVAVSIVEEFEEGSGIVVSLVGIFMITGIPIWFMYRWATAYNKQHWGYASHKDCMKSDES